MMLTLPTLYSLTAKGQIQEWTIEVDTENSRYRTRHGKLGGKIQTTEWTITQATNEGRSNERTSHEQAVFEAKALWDKKRDAGATEDPKQVDSAVTFFEPMLAQSYEKVKFSYPVAAQPKMDGARCLATKDRLHSRNGKDWVAVPHISKQLELFFQAYPDAVLDGELYSHEHKDNFNAIMSLVRKTKPTVTDLTESEKLVKYWIYDVYLADSPDLSYDRRHEFLTHVNQHLLNKPNLHLVPTYWCSDQEGLDKCYASIMEQGFEGQIIRTLKGPYEQKRSKHLIKRKEFDDQEYKILDIEEGDGNKTGMAGRMYFETETGISFKSNIKGDREYLRELLINKDQYVGQLATIRFFGKSVDEVPRFPYVYAIRNYE